MSDDEPERYHGLLPVIGPLREPSNRSGVHPLGCSHQAPESCRWCDGQSVEDGEYRSASAAERRAYDRGLAEWRRRFDAAAPTESDIDGSAA